MLHSSFFFLQLFLIAVITHSFNFVGLDLVKYKISQSFSLQNKKIATVILSSALFIQVPDVSNAVSGGGKDFAGKILTDENFEGKTLISKDFTQADAAGVNFKGSVLKGSRFYRANLKDTDFSNADLSAASLEDTSLLGANFGNAILEGTYFSASITQAGAIEGADFTDAQMPDFSRTQLCSRPDAKGKNTKSGVDTLESLMCP
eukprot:gene1205-2340_t